MGLEHLDTGKFLATDIASIGASTTVTDGVEFTSKIIDCTHFEQMSAKLNSQGANASSAGNITFLFLVSLDGTSFESNDNAHPETLVLNADNVVSRAAFLNVKSIRSINLLSIANDDASFAVNNTNVEFFMKSLEG